jgi:hypothetical protein
MHAAVIWARKHRGSILKSILLCDLPKKKLGSVQMFVDAFDETMRKVAVAESKKAADITARDTGESSVLADVEAVSHEGRVVLEGGERRGSPS